MFDWIAKTFFSKSFSVSTIPHYARVWWSIESANLMLQHFSHAWTPDHDPSLRRLRWTKAVIRKHIVENDVRDDRLAKCIAHSLRCGGEAMRLRLAGIGESAVLFRHAAHAAHAAAGGPVMSTDCSLELYSDAYDISNKINASALFDRIESVGNEISEIAVRGNWGDSTLVPAQYVDIFSNAET